MKPHHYCWMGIVLVGGVAVWNLLVTVQSKYNNSDIDTAMSSPVAEQNNFWPTGSLNTRVGIDAGSGRHSSSREVNSSWMQGGGSSVTSTTGRWAA